jgi:hypothetical protein
MKSALCPKPDLRAVSVSLLAAGAIIGVMLSSAAAQDARDREAFFGETHVHTGWSFDVYVFGNRTDPVQAYQYAIGENIPHPLGYSIKITTPLDWMGVTDHSEYAGTVMLANTPGTPLSGFAECLARQGQVCRS